jgi:thioredoxin-like negative regulator of GroEL
LPQVYRYPEIVGPTDSAINARSVSEVDVKAMTAEMKLRIPDRREAALQELQVLATASDQAAAKTPNEHERNRKKDDDQEPKKIGSTVAEGNEIAHRALAFDHLQRGEFEGAAEELGNAAALNSRDMWIRYYLCLLKYRISQTKHTELQGLPNMLQDLRAVLEWYSEFADAYDLLATARREGGGPIAAMQAERAAIQLSPRNQWYVFHLAEIYIDDKKWDAARMLLQRLKSGSDAKVAAAAGERLGQIGNEQKYGVSAPEKKLTTQSSPFDVLEQDAAKRAAAAQQGQSAGGDRRPAKFLKGRLVDVDCSHSPVAVLTVNSGGTVLKLRTADYKSLTLIGADTFSCSWSDRSVSVNYKPGGASDGDLVSVEVR